MSSGIFANTSPSASSRRAKVACKSCHARRVKCDAAVSRPCWHCRVRQTPCTLIDSKRGKYVRKNKAADSRGNDLPDTQHRASPATSPSRSINFAPSAAPLSSLLNNVDSHGDNIVTGNHAPDDSDARPQPDQTEGPEMLYARMAEPEPSADSPGSQSRTSSRAFYLGESFDLAYIVKTVCGSPNRENNIVKLHYSVPSSVADPRSNPIEEQLPLREALITPPQEVCDDLVRLFFTCIHPAYPVFDRRAFTSAYRRGQVSILTLQTIMFLAFTICSEDLIRKAGYSDRATARRTHYLRAKALYDADYETDRASIVSVLFLLGFWWAGPEDQKDSWHWLGTSLSLAQTLGMHRSTEHSDLNDRDRSLWKRIWWSIYIRDRYTAASLGRPCRINDLDCDVEMLTEHDMQVDGGYDTAIICIQESYHVSYVIEVSKMAVLLGRIVAGEFAPRRDLIVGYNPKRLVKELTELESQFPQELRRSQVDKSFGPPFWACMLYAFYNNCHTLLCRPKTIIPQSQEERERDHIARISADSTTRIAEDLLGAGMLTYGLLHLVSALFGALSIHAIVIRRKDPIQRQLAENRARQCMLALSELAKSWPVGYWILRLFVNLMSRLTGQRFGFENVTSNMHGTGNDGRNHSGVPTPTVNSARTAPNSNAVADTLGILTTAPSGLDQLELDFQRQQSANQLISDTLWADNGFNFDQLFPDAWNEVMPMGGSQYI